MLNNFNIFFYLIDKKLKKDFFINIFGSFLVMVFEIFSIALIFPAIGFLLDEDISESNPFMKTDIAKLIFITLRDFDLKILVVYFLFFFGFIYLTKVLVTLFFGWRNAKFAFRVRTYLAIRINQLYINQPFSFHISNNSSKIIHNLTQEINIIAQGCNSLLIFITESAVIIGLITFFVFYQPFITVILFIVLLPSLFIFKNLKIYVEKLSRTRQKHDKNSIFLITQIFSGIKDLAILNKSKIFSNKYEFNIKKSSKANAKNSFIALIPRNALDLFLIIGIIGISIFLPLDETNFKNEFLKIMAAFAIASFRIMPALTRIIVSVNVMSYMLPVLKTFFKLYKNLSKNQKKHELRRKIDFDYINIKNLFFQYGKKEIFKNLSFQIKKNQTLGIVGESGSGKTTLINIFLGLLKASKGSITLSKKNGKEIKDIENLRMSHVPQEVFMFDDTLINNICLPGNHKIDYKLLDKALKQADLTSVIKKLPKGLNTKMGERGSKISGGQKQRIGLARALYHDTDLLILDEITSSLDIKSETNIINLISKIKDKTILLITHKKKNLRVCDKILNLNNLDHK
jgi:ABC-type multidrug transport system fused ATPase/permease subunit